MFDNKFIRQYDAIRESLSLHFESEWANLSAEYQSLIIDDVMTAESMDFNIPQYKLDIGEGNLLAYAKCLAI